MTVISKNVFDQLDSVLLPIPSNVNVRTCDGSKCNILGFTTFFLTLGSFVHETTALVLKSSLNECLIGLDVLEICPFTKKIIAALKNAHLVNPAISINNVDCEVNLNIRDDSNNSNIAELTKSLLASIQDICAKSVKDIVPSSLVEHKIILSDYIPFYQKMRPVPYSKKAEFKELLNEMLNVGMLVDSFSPYSSPTNLAKKNDKSIRVTIDYRRLNGQRLFSVTKH